MAFLLCSSPFQALSCFIYSFHLILLCGIFSFMCDTAYPVPLVLLKTLLHLHIFFSVLISCFVLHPFRPCTIYLLFSFLLASIFLQLSVPIQLTVFLSGPQYTQCHFSEGSLHILPPLLYIVVWVSLLTVLLVCVVFILFWHLQDTESIPQFEMQLPSDLRYSQFTLLVC